MRSIETVPKVQEVAMELLCTLVLQLHKKFEIFIPLVNRTLTRHSIVHPRYEFLINEIQTVSDDFAGVISWITFVTFG